VLLVGLMHRIRQHRKLQSYYIIISMTRVRFPAGLSGNFSLRHPVQTGSVAHPASNPVGSGDSFPGGKAAGA